MSIGATLLDHAGAVLPGLAAAWTGIARTITFIATMMLASSMVAIGALVDWPALRRAGSRPMIMAVLGAVLFEHAHLRCRFHLGGLTNPLVARVALI